MYDFSYEFAFYFTKRKPTVNRVLLSLSLLPPPLPLQLSFSLISTFFVARAWFLSTPPQHKSVRVIP